MPLLPRAMALDVGDRTCGIALSDALGITAQPHSTLRFKSESEYPAVFSQLQKIIVEDGVATIVAGLPLNMNASEGPQAEKVRKFIATFQNFLAKNQVDPNELEWVFWDERLSTAATHRHLIAADVSRAKRREVVDKLAATYILQGFMESRRD